MIGRRLCSISFVVTLLFAPLVRAQTVSLFDLPAQPLATSLRSVGSQTSTNVLFDPPLVEGRQAPALKAQLTPAQAITRLLAGTGLRLRMVDEKTIMVVSSSSSADRSHATTNIAPNDSSSRLELAQSSSSSAGEASVPAAPDDTLETIVVTGSYEFLNADTSGATNLPIAIEKVPQSISLVTADFIKAADLKTLGEIAEYTPGAVNAGNQFGLGSIIKLRGFAAGQAVDGLNTTLPSANTIYEPDYAIYDRLEVVKGPTSVVYGVASPGGLVNFVTKSATAQTVDYLSAQYGNWNTYRLEGQFAAPLDSDGRVRVIGVVVQEHGGSFTESVHHTKTTVYGGINATITDSLTAYVHAGYERFVRTNFDGIPTEADGSPAPVSRSFFIGNEDMTLTSPVYHAEGALTWHTSDVLDFTLKGNLLNAKYYGVSPYAFGLETDGDIGLGLERWNSYSNDNHVISLSSLYKFDNWGLKKSFLSIGLVRQENKVNLNLDYYPGDVTANIFSGEASISQAFQAMLNSPLTPYLTSIDAVTNVASAQTVIQAIDPLSLLFGVSYAKPEQTTTSGGVAQNVDAAGQVSYRAGLTYEVVPRVNVYASYSESFSPQSQLQVNNAVLPPLKGTEYEVGAKYRSSGGRLLLTSAFFQIDENNASQYDTTINGMDYYKAIGRVKHKGMELQAIGQLAPQWQINAAYAYLDPRVVQDSDPSIVGQTELYLPKQTASLFTNYVLDGGFGHGLSYGGGVRYVSSQRTAFDDSTHNLPGYVLFDGAVGYSIQKWLVQLNAHNILNKRYFINNYQTLYYGNQIGEPFNVDLTVRRQF